MTTPIACQKNKKNKSLLMKQVCSNVHIATRSHALLAIFSEVVGGKCNHTTWSSHHICWMETLLNYQQSMIIILKWMGFLFFKLDWNCEWASAWGSSCMCVCAIFVNFISCTLPDRVFSICHNLSAKCVKLTLLPTVYKGFLVCVQQTVYLACIAE